MYRKFATMLLALLLVTTAAPAESSREATARQLVPPTATITETDRDDGLWEYEFRDGAMRYEVVLRDETPVALITRNTDVKSAPTNLLTLETATAGIPGEVLHAQAEKDDGRWVWKVIAREGSDLMEYELNAETGAVIELERYYNATLELPASFRKLELELDDGRLQWDMD